MKKNLSLSAVFLFLSTISFAQTSEVSKADYSTEDASILHDTVKNKKRKVLSMTFLPTNLITTNVFLFISILLIQKQEMNLLNTLNLVLPEEVLLNGGLKTIPIRNQTFMASIHLKAYLKIGDLLKPVICRQAQRHRIFKIAG